MNVNRFKKKVLYLTVLLLVVIQGLSAQSGEYLYGYVLDASNGEAIVFANIHLKDRQTGVISNFDGGFRIPSNYKELGDILVFSSMGYEKEELSITEFIKDTNVVVKLRPSTLQLTEVDVIAPKRLKKELSPKEIVSKAISLITSNYPIEPYSQIGYYRDYQMDHDEIINLNEAIIEVVDQGFNAVDSTTSKVLIYDYIENIDFRRDTFALKPYDYDLKEGGKVIDRAFLDGYGGNEFVILSVHNAIRNHEMSSYSFVYKLDTDLLNEHSFKRTNDTFLNDDYVYTIEFTKKKYNYLAVGKLYINKSNFSINRLEYALYHTKGKNSLNVSDKNGVKKTLIFDVVTEYRKNGDKMFLNFISLNNNFKVLVPPKINVEFIDFNFTAERLEKKKIEFNHDNFVLNFNKDINGLIINNLWKKGILFKGQSIKIDRAVVIGNQLVLYPNLSNAKFKNFFEEFDVEKEQFMSDLVEFNLSELRDDDGNEVGMWTTKYYNQYREYFVQENNSKPRYIDNSLLMDKKRPIFDNQPNSKPNNFDNYWMNTPLRSTVDQ